MDDSSIIPCLAGFTLLIGLVHERSATAEAHHEPHAAPDSAAKGAGSPGRTP